MHTFSLLNNPDLKLGLDDLFTKRHAALVASKVGKGYEDILAYQRKAIDALPPALTGGRPLAEELSVTDDEHDSFGAGLWHLTEAYLRIPNVDPKIVEAARRIRAAFIPEISQLQDSYADQAEAAARRKAQIKEREADLKLIPIAGKGTLLDWATSFLAAGDKLSTLLSQRADIDAIKRKDAKKLRSETVGILNELRTAIAREQQRSPNSPKDLDAQIFSYFDTLEAQREAANRAAKAAKGKAPAEPSSPEEGDKNAS